MPRQRKQSCGVFSRKNAQIMGKLTKLVVNQKVEGSVYQAMNSKDVSHTDSGLIHYISRLSKIFSHSASPFDSHSVRYSSTQTRQNRNPTWNTIFMTTQSVVNMGKTTS